MIIKNIRLSFLLIFFFFWANACTKKETITLDNNTPPTFNHVPNIKIENYVNRLFIDLIGREPIDAEMNQAVQTLRTTELSKEGRLELIIMLQSSTDFIDVDTSYQKAYYRHLYNLAKARCLEGIADYELAWFISDEIQNDTSRLGNVMNSPQDMQKGLIQIDGLFARMVYNGAYDKINMNAFNFVNAVFDNLLWRFPSNSEFNAGFNMVERNASGIVFGQAGQNKADFVNIVTTSREMFQGIIIWVFQQAFAREPTSQELKELMDDFYEHRQIELLQQKILIKDEYANF